MAAVAIVFTTAASSLGTAAAQAERPARVLLGHGARGLVVLDRMSPAEADRRVRGTILTLFYAPRDGADYESATFVADCSARTVAFEEVRKVTAGGTLIRSHPGPAPFKPVLGTADDALFSYVCGSQAARSRFDVSDAPLDALLEAVRRVYVPSPQGNADQSARAHDSHSR